MQAAREAARRTQCNNNLKQIGLGIQNYHDIRQEIVPAWLSTATDVNGILPASSEVGRAAWTLLILPFMEQTNVYDLMQFNLVLTQDPPNPLQSNHRNLRSTSIATYFCPSRRTPPALTVSPTGERGSPTCAAWATMRRLPTAAASRQLADRRSRQ